jgi:hypothetical protein
MCDVRKRIISCTKGSFEDFEDVLPAQGRFLHYVESVISRLSLS